MTRVLEVDVVTRTLPIQHTVAGYVAAWHGHPKVLPRGPGLAGTAPPSEQHFDTLLLYLYADTDRHYRRNLEFFVEHGIHAGSSAALVKYVIIVNAKVRRLCWSHLVLSGRWQWLRSQGAACSSCQGVTLP